MLDLFINHNKLKKWGLILLLGLITFAVYANSLQGDFLIDDTVGILQNKEIHHAGVYFSEYFSLRPNSLVEAARVLIWHFWGANTFAFHLFNILIHLGCVILIFLLCDALFSNRALSFLSSLIFAVHPIHTEAISWISGGPYALSSLFFIASFLFFVKSGKSISNLVFSIICFSLCFLSGNAVAVLPLMFICYEFCFRKKNEGSRFLYKLRIILLVLLSAISLLFIGLFFVSKNEFMHLIFYFRGFGYLAVVFKAFIYYLKILYLPLQRGLVHPFAFNVTNIQSFSPTFFLSLTIIAIAIVTFFKCRRNFKPISFGIIWFFVTYAPYSNIIPVCNIISERYLYLPSLGFSIVLAALFLKGWELIKRNQSSRYFLRAMAIVAITLFIGSYSVLTIKRNYEYSNIITYWESNINNFKDGHMVYNNLAGTYYLMGNIDNAIAYSWINLISDSNQPHVWYNLGNVYQERGDIRQAKECFQEVLKIDKDYFPAYKALEQLKIK